jgi:hypothetical protein
MDHRLRLNRRTARAEALADNLASSQRTIPRIIQNAIKTMTIKAGGIKTIQPLVLRSKNWKAASTIIHI